MSLAVNLNFFFSLLIILIGYVCKRVGVVKEDDGDALARVILNVTLPALILKTVTNIEIDAALAVMPVVAILFCSASFGLAYLLFRRADSDRRGILMMCAMGFNIGLFAFPLVEGVWGAEGLAYLSMFDLGNAVIMFGLVYVVACVYAPDARADTAGKKAGGKAGKIESHGAGTAASPPVANSPAPDDSRTPDGSRGPTASGSSVIDVRFILKRLGTSVPLLSYIVALVLNLAGVRVTGVALDFFDVLARANMALVLLLLGIILTFSFDRAYWKDALKVIALRYAAGIAAGLVLYALLAPNPAIPDLFATIVAVSLVLPVGMAVIPYAVQLGYDRRLTGAIVNLSIVISFGLVWLLTAVLQA